MLTQNLIDLLAAGFVFLLFAAIYRKRSTAAVGFWMAGWFFVVLHFAALTWPVAHTPMGESTQGLISLATLVLCALAFVLSREEAHRTRGRRVTICCALGLPWMGAILCAALPETPFVPMAVCAYLASAAMLFVMLQYFRTRRREVVAGVLVALGCGTWLTVSLHMHDPGLLLSIVLTQCFGLNAVLLTFCRLRFSAATATTSVGAVAWGAVWVTGALLGHFAPNSAVSPEMWNLPKYIVAAGMILTLLEEEIRSAEVASEQYRLLFAGNPHPMWMYDPETLEFLEVNDAAIAHYGFSREDFRSMSLLDVFSEDCGPDVVEALRDGVPQQLSGPWLHRAKSGSAFQVDIASQPVFQEGRRAIFAMMHDVTERLRLHAQLMRRAHHDVLTDLPNRALFEGRLEDSLEYAQSMGQKVAIFCIDLDRFKQINDSYGHAAGDLCLKEAASRITRRLSGRGTLARSGGDEFMLYLSEIDTAEEADVFAAALLRDLRASVQIGTGDLELAASIGFALYPDDGTESGQLRRDADAAMYQAKRAGGGQSVRVSSEISNFAHQANEVELGLRRALKAGNIDVHYQPQMTVDGQVHGFEALFRSRDPLLEHVAPGRTIGIAEESGLIVPLGNWMLDEICRQCREWIDDGLAPVRVGVNVSPLQLTRFDFARQVAKTLEKYRLDPRIIEFEVTESTMMPDRGGDAPHQIAMLAQMGISFSVDDFGTGYSSLGRLHQLPVDSLKIDRSFTQRIAESNGTYPTVEAIIALAHTFGMKVIAEGVETQQQMELLRTLACDRVQGFLFSQPLPAEDATGFLRATAEFAVEEFSVS